MGKGAERLAVSPTNIHFAGYPGVAATRYRLFHGSGQDLAEYDEQHTAQPSCARGLLPKQAHGKFPELQRDP
mgnify:CR=1 FL=1